MHDLSTPEQRPKSTPWQVKLAVLLVLPLLLGGLFLILWRMAFGAMLADGWRGKGKSGRRLAILDPEEPAPPEHPTLPYLRNWFAGEYGRRPPFHLGKAALWDLWSKRYEIGGALYRHRPERIFVVAGTPNCDPPRTPLDVEHHGGEFVYMTNRGGAAFSYLAKPGSLNPRHNDSLPFSMGYSNLWVCQHDTTIRAVGDPARPWRSLAYEQYPNGPMGKGEWVVFRDPTLSKHRENHSAATLVDRFNYREAALACARAFTSEYNVATFVARLVADHSWH